MFEGLTIWHLLQLGATVITVAGGWFTLKAQVGEMSRTQTAHKEEMDARFKAGNERALHQEAQFDEHVKESMSAREDIAEMKADMKHIVRSLDRLVARDS